MSIGNQIDERFRELEVAIDAAKAAGATGRQILEMQVGTLVVSVAELEERLAALEATPQPEPEPEPEPQPGPFRGIQIEYDALPAGATELVIPAGTYTEELRLHRPSVKVRGVLSGGGVEIHGRIHIAAGDVTLQDVRVVEGVNRSPDYWGTIWSDGVEWVTLQDVSVSGAEWAGVALKGGSGHFLSGVEAYENGVVGIRLESCRDTTVTSSWMRNNNTRGLNPGWEAGGLKATGNYGGIQGVAVEGSHAHHNDGPGIWFDIDASNIVIRNNSLHHNTRAGIIYELAWDGTIHHNAIYENGYGFPSWGFGAGILLQNARNCHVHDNVLAWNADGLIIMSQDRGSRWNDVTGNRLENNVIGHIDGSDFNTFASAVLQDWAGNATGSNSGNVGVGNRYYYTRSQDWVLRHRNGGSYWHRPAGPFAGDSVIDKAALDAVLADAGVPTEPERGG